MTAVSFPPTGNLENVIICPAGVLCFEVREMWKMIVRGTVIGFVICALLFLAGAFLAKLVMAMMYG
jgi:hypothetical protein